MDNFYVYVYLDPRKPGSYIYGSYSFEYEPIYVGKGKDGRIFGHLDEAYNFKDTNKFKCNKIRKIKFETGNDPIVIKYFENLTEEKSFEFEIDMIKTIGKGNHGPLTNLTDGGSGGVTHNATEEEKLKASIRFKKLWTDPNFKLKLRVPKRIKRNEEQNKQISERNTKW